MTMPVQYIHSFLLELHGLLENRIVKLISKDSISCL